MVDFFLLFFNVFQSCYLENLFMLVGTFVQSPSGASNYAVTIGYEFFNYSNAPATSLVGLVNTAVEKTSAPSAVYTDGSQIGKAVGQVFKGIFEYSIPVYQLNAY